MKVQKYMAADMLSTYSTVLIVIVMRSAKLHPSGTQRFIIEELHSLYQDPSKRSCGKRRLSPSKRGWVHSCPLNTIVSMVDETNVHRQSAQQRAEFASRSSRRAETVHQWNQYTGGFDMTARSVSALQISNCLH
jgi:hypothetical protein